MPSRKKSRIVVPTPPAHTTAEDGATELAKDGQVEETKYDPLRDLWTDEQETSLYKAIVKWKPAGMHKHFRMIAISDYLRNHGYDPQFDTHTRIPGIWEKLGREYNLLAIDEREQPHPLEENLEKKYREFRLTGPDNENQNTEFEDMMIERAQRLSPDASSPPQVSRSPSLQSTRKRKRVDTVTRKRGGTVDDTDEPRTSPPTSSPAKATRSGRSTTRAASRAKAGSRSREASKDDPMDFDEGDDAQKLEEDQEEEEAGSSPKLPRGRAQKAQVNPRKSLRKR